MLDVSHKLIPGDVWTSRSWALAHHVGVLTLPHHNVEGMCTFVAPMSGTKDWVIMSPKKGMVSRGKMAGYFKKLTSMGKLTSVGNLPSTFSDKMHMETVHLSAGDLL